MLSPHVNPYYFIYLFKTIYQNMGQKLGSNTLTQRVPVGGKVVP